MKARIAGMILIALAAPAAAQVRIVSWNTLDGPDSLGDPDFRTVFEAIAGSSINGITRRPSVVTLQEQTATSTANLAALLNNLYGVRSYVALQPAAGQTPTDRLGFVYDTSAVQLAGPAAVVASGGTRPHLRAQFSPVGYTSPAASFHVYASHLNASSATTRATEASALRADADGLGVGANVVQTGDLNVPGNGEAAYVNLTAAGGAGRTFDPLNRPGTWKNNSSFADIHTQSTRVAQFGGGASGGMDDRFDFQLASAPMMDAEGLSYIGPTVPGTAAAHSYRAFGNGGTTFDGNINDPANTSQPRTVLDALYNASDHLPVVADYQIPARMHAQIGATIPPRAIVGAALTVQATVTNTAPVAVPAAADELDYAISGGGAVSGSGAGVATATLAGNVHTLVVDSATPGIANGSVNVSSSSQGAQDASFAQAISTTVLAHANGSFAPDADEDALSIDFGIRARGSGAAQSPFGIFNLDDPSGFTAGLDLDQIAASGDTQRLSATVDRFSNLAAGASAAFSANLDTSATGSFATSYILHLSDEDLPGAAALATMSLNLTARVAIGGDANLDDAVSLADFNILAANFGSFDQTWQGADFTGDGAVDLADFNILASNFGLAAAAGGPTPQDWAGLSAAVPEPVVGVGAAATILLGGRRRRRRLCGNHAGQAP